MQNEKEEEEEEAEEGKLRLANEENERKSIAN